MRLTVTSHLTLDGVMQSNGKPEPELNDGFDTAAVVRDRGVIAAGQIDDRVEVRLPQS
jgi:hypothetical protein